MRSLTDLLADEHERVWLAERGMYSDIDEFLEAMAAPESDALNSLVGQPEGTLLVHIGQQVCTDYHPATLRKFSIVPELRAHDGVAPVILWHNTDRADSERFGMRIVLAFGSKTIGLSLAPRSAGACEPRFIDVEPKAVDDALEQMRRWASGRNQDRAKPERTAAAERLAALCAAMVSDEPRTLDEFNAQFAGYLLAHGHGLEVPSTFLSTMIDVGMLTESVDQYLECIDDVVTVFNESVAELVARDIDPHVKPLADDYLPLHYSCPTTGRRMRLAHVVEGGEHFACSDCPCGTTHSFSLGTSTLSIAELAATGRWSPDVSLPVHHNHIASGWVVGRSTAVYGVVLNAVAAKVLGQRPIPGLIPSGLLSAEPDLGADSLLAEYLTR